MASQPTNMAKNKMGAPRTSGNSSKDTPVIAMNLDTFLIEVTSNVESEDKNLRATAKEVQKRYNAHESLSKQVANLREAMERVRDWSNARDGSAEADETALCEINGIAMRFGEL